MVRMLWTTSILSLLLATLVFTLGIRDLLRPRLPVERLGITSMIDRSKQRTKGKADPAQPQVSALVQQAQALELLLNPPRASKQSPVSPTPQAPPPVAQAKPASSSARFELHGISYHRSKPTESMALVCEPGSGRRWVRQGAQIGHIVIEKITSTAIVCRDGERTQEIALASGQVLTMYAKDHNKKAVPRPLPELSKPSPPSVRGIRRMPASYAAAKMGLQLAQAEVPGDSTANTR